MQGSYDFGMYDAGCGAGQESHWLAPVNIGIEVVAEKDSNDDLDASVVDGFALIAREFRSLVAQATFCRSTTHRFCPRPTRDGDK